MSTSLDVRTLIILTVNGDIPVEEGLARIADECEISPESLIKALTKTNKTPLSIRRWTQEDDAKVIELWNAGMSAGNIAKTLNRSRNGVAQRVFFLRGEGHELAKRETAGIQAIRNKKAQQTLF